MKRVIAIGLLLGSCAVVLGQAGGAPENSPPSGRGGGAAATAPGGGGGRRGGPGGATTEPAAEKPVVTAHQITINGAALKYTATSGYMPLKDETGKLRANIFFVAYTKDGAVEEKAGGGGGATGADGEKVVRIDDNPAATAAAAAAAARNAARPITFVFNGGPGAAAVWLHLGTAGPYRVVLNPDGTAPTPPYHMVENQFTWLADTDLVLIDPVGTGYSRAATPEQNRDFYNLREDINSVGEFIRLYTTKYQRWDSPKFLAGESFGTTRAAALAEHLQEDVGLALNGVILISTVLNFGNLQPSEGNDLPYALFLPTYTATAFFHKKLPDDLMANFEHTMDESKDFAATAYNMALARGASLLPADRAAIVEKVARFTGLSQDLVDKSNLRISPWRFEGALLGEQRKMIGRMDSRLTAYTSDAADAKAEFDPAVSTALPVYTAMFNSYVRSNLKYESDLPYEVLKGIPFNFNAQNAYLYVGDDLRSAMQKNPHLKVLFASGYYDLATPFFATDYTITHMTLAPELRKNITQTYYPGGHMVYHEPNSLQKLHEDIGKFIQGAMAK